MDDEVANKSENTTDLISKTESNSNLVLGLVGLVVVVLLIGVGFFFLNSSSDSKNEDKVTETEESQEGIVTYEIPDGWIEDDGSIIGETQIAGMKPVYIFAQEELDNPDGFAENINYLTESVGDYTFDEYLDLSLEQLTNLIGDEYQFDQIKFNGFDAADLSYNLGEIFIWQRIVLINGTSHIFTFSSTSADSEYLEDFMSLVESIQVD